MVLSFVLETDTAGVNDYAIQFQKINAENFVGLIKTAHYGDNLTTEQLRNIGKLELKEFELLLTDNELALPYSNNFKSVRRFYRLILDISAYDGKNGNPDYRDIWSDLHLTIIARLNSETHGRLDNELLEVPKLTIDFVVTDCDIVFDELELLVDQLSDDLSVGDLTFIKNIITKCNCGADTTDVCELAGEEYQEFNLPTFESESILYELTNIDSLICYLKNMITNYKTDIARTSNESECYKFVPCLIRAYISINKLYRKVQSSYKSLLLSANYLSEQYVALASDHRRGIESIKGIIKSNSDWIKTNIDPNFDITKVTCSNKVETIGDVTYTFKERYSKYFDKETKRYNIV